jgi:hypothetical protein
MTLYFPDYSLPWGVRCDAAKFAVGGLLFQVFTDPTTKEEINQLIACVSKRFSKPAVNWDAYKREAFAIYNTVSALSYYLRGKDFIVETDHRNLQWIEQSVSPIVVRWRSLLQSFTFLIKHIAGKLNKFADWQSRMGFFKLIEDVPQQLAPVLEEQEQPEFEQIMLMVHGGRSLHFGAAETWRKAKILFPTAKITMAAVRHFVKECPICQKMRDTGVKGLPEQYLSLKPSTYRRAVGVDHVAVTPADKHGNCCAVLIVEFYSHFPQAYAAKSYSAESVAIALFKHFCTFGIFDQLVSDPGSAFMSDVVAQLNSWLGVQHKVSLIGRHESNGCESTGKELVRHLRTLVSDERLLDSWSDDTVLPIINFSLANHPSSETGGYTPFELKYGSSDAKYFHLPSELTPGARCHEVLKLLNENLVTVRSISSELQAEIVRERSMSSKQVPKFESGDLILWNPRETPEDFLDSKLSPPWLGPYEVTHQVKNDIECIHVNLRTVHTFHVSRVKPFFGTREDALKVAKLDKNQFFIVSFNYYSGNPHKRYSLKFNVTFEDGTVDIDFNRDLADSQQYADYAALTKSLLPLRFRTAKEAEHAMAQMNQLAITSFSPGDTLLLDLRYFDHVDLGWFDSLNLPLKTSTYVFQATCLAWPSPRQNRLSISIQLLNHPCILKYTSVEMYAYRTEARADNVLLVDEAMIQAYPAISALGQRDPVL